MYNATIYIYTHNMYIIHPSNNQSINEPTNQSINQSTIHTYISHIYIYYNSIYIYTHNFPSSMFHSTLGGSWCPCWPSSWSLWKSPKPCWRFSCCFAWGAGRTSSPGAVVATATDTGLAGGRCNVKRWGDIDLAGDWKTNFEGL